MTTIAALRTKSKTVVGADGLVCWGDEVGQYEHDKLISVRDEICIGLSGQMRAADLWRVHMTSPPVDVTSMVQMARGIYEAAGFGGGKSDRRGPPEFGISHILATQDGLWEIGSTLCAVPVPLDWPVAIGSGGQFAVGAMEALSVPGADPYDVVQRALEIAARRDCKTGGRFRFWVYEARA